MIVIDASAVLEILLDANGAGGLASFIGTGRTPLAAPHLIDVEIAQVLRRHVRNKALTPARAHDFLLDWKDFPLTRFPHAPLLDRIFALRDNASAYDAAYIALAEALDAPLLTHDTKFAGIPGHSVSLIVR